MRSRRRVWKAVCSELPSTSCCRAHCPGRIPRNLYSTAHQPLAQIMLQTWTGGRWVFSALLSWQVILNMCIRPWNKERRKSFIAGRDLNPRQSHVPQFNEWGVRHREFNWRGQYHTTKQWQTQAYKPRLRHRCSPIHHGDLHKHVKVAYLYFLKNALAYQGTYKTYYTFSRPFLHYEMYNAFSEITVIRVYLCILKSRPGVLHRTALRGISIPLTLPLLWQRSHCPAEHLSFVFLPSRPDGPLAVPKLYIFS